jgi:hypothetical protein
MAQKARAEQEDLAAKVSELERKVAQLSAAPAAKPAPRRRAARSKAVP